MTIHQMFLGDDVASAAATISYKAFGSSATNSVTIPSHATGDLIIISALNTSSSTPPTIPTGWTQIETGSIPGWTYWGYAAAYKLAESGAETSGTWTGATYMSVAVYDGVASVGTAVEWTGNETTYWSSVSVGGSESWVVGLGFFQGGSHYATPPSGMTHRGVSGEVLSINDTASIVSAWNVKTTTGIWQARTATLLFELVAE